MTATYRSIREDLYNTALVAVQEKVLPPSLQLHKDSLLKKLRAEIERNAALYEQSETRYRMPSMGVVELSHESLDEAIALFGTDIRAKDVVRIRVYAASRNLVENKIEKEGLLNEVIMSEMQFGTLLMNASCGTGYPVTLLTDSGEAVAPYDEKRDLTKRRIPELMAKLTKNPEQVRGHIAVVQELVNKALESGRLGKKDADEIAKKMALMTDHTVGGCAYDLRILTEEMVKRTNEAVLNMNISGRLLMLSENTAANHAIVKKD